MYEPGTVLMGKYRVGRVIGRGGMGVVMACEHVELRTGVALKFLAEKYVDREDIVERFVREARACAQLRSENICKVTDVGRLETGVPYFVMELLEGRDLAKTLRQGGPLDVTTAADYILQACDAVAEAHSAHIIHRDLKPGNLFLTQRRDGGALIKVLDFGVAKARVEEQNHTLTGADVVVGSPSYMAPEQIRSSHHADPRSDIWSLGVILHEMLSGKPPFKGETIADLAVRITLDPLPPLLGVPPAFARIVAKCLEKNPADRFQHVADLALALEPFAPLVAAPSRSSALRARSFGTPPVGAVPPPVSSGTPTVPMPAMAALAAAAGRPTAPLRAPVMSQQMTSVHYAEPPVPASSTTIRGASGVVVGPGAIAQPASAGSGGGRRWLTIGVVAAVVIGVGAGIVVGTSKGSASGSHAAASPTPAPTPSPTPSPSPSPSPTPSPSPSPTPSPSVSPPPIATVPADAGVTVPVVAAPDPPPVVPPPVKRKIPTVTPKTKEQVGASRI